MPLQQKTVFYHMQILFSILRKHKIRMEPLYQWFHTEMVRVPRFAAFWFPSGIRINVLPPSSRRQATVHRKVASSRSNLSLEKWKPKEHTLFRFSWSECRDSNSGPLEPHSSAIPNFATPGKEQSLDCLSILAHSSGKCKHYFHFPESFFIQLSSAPALIFIGL